MAGNEKLSIVNQTNFRRHSAPARPSPQYNPDLNEEHFLLYSCFRRASTFDSYVLLESHSESESSTGSELDTSYYRKCTSIHSESSPILEGSYCHLPSFDFDVADLNEVQNQKLWRAQDACCPIWKNVFLSHLLSVCLAAIIFFNDELKEDPHLKANGQNLPFYIMLSLLWTTKLALRNRGNDMVVLFRNSGIRYFCLAIFHVELNALLLLTLRHNSYFGNELIDCVAASLALFIAYILLEVRFQWIHVIGYVVNIFGCLGFSTVRLTLNEDKEPLNMLLGDILRVASGACLAYNSAIQEIIVKATDPVEYSGMMALIASFVCGTQAIFIEEFFYQERNIFCWSKLLAYSIAQFSFQSLMPRMLRDNGTTGFHLMLISTSFYSHCLDAIVNRNQIFYLIPYMATTVGSFLFAVKKTFIGTQNCFPIKTVTIK